jgi:hypothetical protein
VFDGMGRDIISSVLRVNDLRAWGVTIHLYVLSGRRSFSYCTDHRWPFPETLMRRDTQFQTSP